MNLSEFFSTMTVARAITLGIVLTIAAVFVLRFLLFVRRQWKCQEVIDEMRKCEVREMHCRLHLEELIRQGTLANIPGAAAVAEHLYQYFTGSDRKGPETAQEWARLVDAFRADCSPNIKRGRPATHRCQQCGMAYHLRAGDALTCYAKECSGVLEVIGSNIPVELAGLDVPDGIDPSKN